MHEITEQQIEESVKNSEREEKIEFEEDIDKPITTLNSEEIQSEILPVEEQNFVDLKFPKFRS